MKLHVCSFASRGFIRQQHLQKKAFIEIGFSDDQIYTYGPDFLGEDFHENIPSAEESNRFGYFSFKPYLISKVMAAIPAGDLLLYLDVNDSPMQGLSEYINLKFLQKKNLNLLVAGTNYQNIRHLSWYHRDKLGAELIFASCLNCQPEAGAIAVRNTPETRILLNIWFNLTLLHAKSLMVRDDDSSRHDQETLYLLARLNNSVEIESWWSYKLSGRGLRKYINWEVFRNG